MTRKIGVRISRAFGDLVVLEVRRGKPSILLEDSRERPFDQPADETLSVLLASVPAGFRSAPLAVSLSSGDLACADLCIDPPRVKRSELDKIVPGLCEAQTVGRNLESLSIDAVSEGATLEMTAIDTELLAKLVKGAREKSFRLSLLTASPIVLAHSVPKGTAFDLRHGRERLRVEHSNGHPTWRSHPDDQGAGDVEPTPVSLLGMELEPRQVIPVSVALADPDRMPNLLRGAPDAPRTFSRRIRGALYALGASAALLLVAIGFAFQSESVRLDEALGAAASKERELWGKVFPERKPIPGLLVRSMREHLLDTGGASGAGEYPSALHFWAEFGEHLPDVDQTGLVLESLDLSPEGGRISAKVAIVKGDPLKNATLLEGQLNESQTLSARGDYERRGTEVQVRLRMDFRKEEK